MNRLLIGRGTDPWENLALEEYLFDTQEAGATLYLWQNQNTVVIGRNQNAWKECRAELLERDGGRLARRSSGGGAVFHDLGNLNFTFLLPREDYDLTRQFSVIQRALSSFGVEAIASGRNDLVLTTGEKFSGNAFRFAGNTAMQHGTLLVDVDMDKLSRYLQPSKLKLQAKGVDSVRSRVKNLHEVCPDIRVDSLGPALETAFQQEYGEAELWKLDDAGKMAVETIYEKNASWDWRYGKTPRFDVSLETRFPWGEVQILLSCREGKVASVCFYTDCMDETLAKRAEDALLGAQYQTGDIAGRLWCLGGEQGENLSNWIAEQTL